MERLAGLAQRGVLELAFLAAGAAHEHGSHALGVVFGQGRRALRSLVVGVRMDGEDRPGIDHAVTISMVVWAQASKLAAIRASTSIVRLRAMHFGRPVVQRGLVALAALAVLVTACNDDGRDLRSPILPPPPSTTAAPTTMPPGEEAFITAPSTTTLAPSFQL
ncbi:MAG TPA: hypothetical protein VFD53_07070, partial [Ilumatobacter sp.]|nr:hypothetical protein [Ilumatobacter sp.]